MSDDKKQSSHGYNAEAVQAEIDKANASGKLKISKKEAALIHALLKGGRK
jgi:hypothetical protein